MFIQNRAGRIVEVPEDMGNDMIKNDGAILANPESESDDENNGENENSNPSDESLKCPYCGKVCANLLGFNKHVEACKKKAIESANPNEDVEANQNENGENNETTLN